METRKHPVVPSYKTHGNYMMGRLSSIATRSFRKVGLRLHMSVSRSHQTGISSTALLLIDLVGHLILPIIVVPMASIAHCRQTKLRLTHRQSLSP